MKRSPLRRRTPLLAKSKLDRGSSRLRRRSPVNPINRERRAKLYAKQFGSHADLIRALPCAACGHEPPSHPHHVTTRGASGNAEQQIPLCAPDPRMGYEGCHEEVHRVGRITFQRIHNINFARTAAFLSGERQVALIVAGKAHEVMAQLRTLTEEVS